MALGRIIPLLLLCLGLLLRLRYGKDGDEVVTNIVRGNLGSWDVPSLRRAPPSLPDDDDDNDDYYNDDDGDYNDYYYDDEDDYYYNDGDNVPTGGNYSNWVWGVPALRTAPPPPPPYYEGEDLRTWDWEVPLLRTRPPILTPLSLMLADGANFIDDDDDSGDMDDALLLRNCSV